MRTLLDKLAGFWRSLDSKLKAAIGGAVISYVTARYGIRLDADTAAIVSGVVASALGYRTPNVGSELRAAPRTYVAEDSGGVKLPPGELG